LIRGRYGLVVHVATHSRFAGRDSINASAAGQFKIGDTTINRLG
jgi:hypothetical protein